MAYISEDVDDVRVIHLIGPVDVPNAVRLRNELGRVTATPRDRVLVDLSDVSMVDSSGIGVLVAATRRARSVGARLAIAAPQERVERVLRLTGTSELLELHSSVRAGSAALAAA